MGIGIVSNQADVGGVLATDGQMHILPETDAAANPGGVGAVRMFSENDSGAYTGTPYLQSPETDDDFRLRTANDIIVDAETMNYTAQNTGKHTYANTTLTALWTTAGLQTNGGAVTTTTTGLTVGTYAEFPVFGSCSTYCEMEGGFNANPSANVYIDFGMFRRGASTAYAPTDGAYFRFAPTGILGVINYNGTETTAQTTFVPVINQKYRWIISLTQREIEFWVNDELVCAIVTPVGQGQPFMSSTLPFSVRHAHVGTAGAAVQFNLAAYTVSLGGALFNEPLGSRLNGVLGSYQGLSGGTMGGLSAYTNSTNPTAAVPSNTALTANLPAGLGGQAWETATTAVNTDVILMSYQVPAGTISVRGQRLKITGVKMSAYIQTVIAGGPFNNTFALAFGHTAVSLATAEAATTKKPRIVLLPELTQTVTAAQAVNTAVSQPGGCSVTFSQPIYVNPGEFVQFTMKRIGTVGTSGVIAYNIQYDYSWE